jgi:hypothetical protein
MKKIYFNTLLFATVLGGLSCTQKYNVGPQVPSQTVSTSTPNPLICTPTQTVGPPPAGIYWYSAQIEGITLQNGVTLVNGIYAQALLSVNGNPETSDTVTIAGPGGFGATLPYTSNVVENGNTYAQYQGLFSNNFQTGGAYSLSTVTSLGTASATLIGPGNISTALNGSSTSWTQPGALNRVLLQEGPSFQAGGLLPVTLYQTASCMSDASPVNIPSSDYSNPGIYTLTTNCQNLTNGITGGTGFFEVSQNNMMFLAESEPPTATPGTCTSGPTCTPTVTGCTDMLTVAPAFFAPPGIVTINGTLCGSGYFNISVYGPSGSMTKELEAAQLGSFTTLATLDTWDGTDSFGNPAPDGVYTLSVLEPGDWKLSLILLLR